MKENKYDNKDFFIQYSKMERSKKGLQGAGEWFELKKLLSDIYGKKILDLGCGYGWHCKYFIENGAEYVLGTDISHKMLEVAKEKNNDSKIIYKCIAMEDLNFPQKTFDIVFSSLAFHYVKDFQTLVKNIFKWLKIDGELIFSVEHPVFTSYGTQDWYYDNEGNIIHFPVDNYFYEGKRDTVFLGEKIEKYHRTLTTYLNTLLQNGFEFQNIIEPQPPEEMIKIPGMKNELRRPMMLLISVKKSNNTKKS